MQLATRGTFSALLAAVIAGCGFLGIIPLQIALIVTCLMFAFGWPYLLMIRSKFSASVVIALGGFGAIVTVIMTEGRERLVGLPLVVALAVILAFVNELFRRDNRVKLIESVTAVVSGVVISAALAGWIALADGGDQSQSLVILAAGALAITSAISSVDLGPWGSVIATVLGGTLIGALIGMSLPELQARHGLVVGFIVGVLVTAMVRMFHGLPSSAHRMSALAVVSLPIAVMGVLLYGVDRVFLG